ncbi:hypothetical protein F511_26971 [Dorcoceras hygrometricum]|uniref:Uncharacterized protein n=1 Tax=Dorcoceras hygrometricum TaxID=472368 RepID=A0A2Z7CRN6_9LAMI|nr:hypothetical protein F511_26971 [Dorcoceras hygrometricum]
MFLESLTWERFKVVFFDKYCIADAGSQLIRVYESPPGRQVCGRVYIRHDVNMVDVATYMSAVNRAYRFERGRKDMRDDFQRKRQLQQPVRGQSSQQPAKRPFQGPPKGPSPQGSQQPRPQG